MNKVTSLNGMEVLKVSMLLLLVIIPVTNCHVWCSIRPNFSFYSVENHFLKGHSFQFKTVSSPVVCGRDCSLSPQCRSFNYNPSNHQCELNNASRANNAADLVKLQSWVYYDETFENLSSSALDRTVSIPSSEAVPVAETTNTVEDSKTATKIEAASASTAGVEKTTARPETITSVQEDATPTTSAEEAVSKLGTETVSVTHDRSDTSAKITSSQAPETQQSCKELQLASHQSNDIYTIYPDGVPEGVQVYCDMETDGGGWIVFQRRQDGSVNFYRNWADYQAGFGNLNGEFWLGNDNLRTLTGSGQWDLRIDMNDWDGYSRWALYSGFAISGDEYRITVGLFDNIRSTTVDSLAIHDGHPFTTRDRDHDSYGPWNCAVKWEGAWWFNACFTAHLNGKYYHSAAVAINEGIQWSNLYGFEYSLKECSMKIRET